MAFSTPTPAPALTRRQTLMYSLGQFAWASKDTCFHYFLFFYYTQFLGLSASLAGLAAMLALIADGISDPIIGQLSDNWRSRRWGRRHGFMALAMLPYAAALLAIFNPPELSSQAQLFAWYLVFAITVRTFLTLFTVPHMALGAELSEDYGERNTIASNRNIMGYIGGLLIQVVAWFLIIPAATADGDTAAGYRNIGFFAAALALVGMSCAVLGTRRRIPWLMQISESQSDRPWYLAFRDLLSLLRHRSVAILFLGSLFLVTKVGVSNTLLLHVNTYIYGFSSQQTGIFMLTIFLSLFPALWLAVRGVERFGKRRALVVFILVETAIAPLAVMAHAYGLTPPSGSSVLLLIVCISIALHQTFHIAGINVASGMLPDVADELQLTSGLRQEGMLNSVMMLTQKVSFGLGSFVAGLIIDFTGFAGVTDISQATPDIVRNLAWCYGPALILLTLAGAMIYTRYQLTRERYGEIRAELAART